MRGNIINDLILHSLIAYHRGVNSSVTDQITNNEIGNKAGFITIYKKVFKIVVSDAQKQPCTGEGGVAKIKICQKKLFGTL